jgi:hypothetical protein
MIAMLCQAFLFIHTWYDHLPEEFDKIKLNTQRIESMCSNTSVVAENQFFKECKTYEKIKDQNPYYQALVEVIKQHAICDIDSGGCKGMIGFVIGCGVIILGLLYLLKRTPSMFMHAYEIREELYPGEFICHSAHGHKHKLA